MIPPCVSRLTAIWVCRSPDASSASLHFQSPFPVTSYATLFRTSIASSACAQSQFCVSAQAHRSSIAWNHRSSTVAIADRVVPSATTIMSDITSAVGGQPESLPSAEVAGTATLASPQTPKTQTQSSAHVLPRLALSSVPTSPTVRHSPRIQHKMSTQNAEAGPSNVTPKSPLRATASGHVPAVAIQAPPAPTYLQPAGL